MLNNIFLVIRVVLRTGLMIAVLNSLQESTSLLSIAIHLAILMLLYSTTFSIVHNWLYKKGSLR